MLCDIVVFWHGTEKQLFDKAPVNRIFYRLIPGPYIVLREMYAFSFTHRQTGRKKISKRLSMCAGVCVGLSKHIHIEIRLTVSQLCKLEGVFDKQCVIWMCHVLTLTHPIHSLGWTRSVSCFVLGLSFSFPAAKSKLSIDWQCIPTVGVHKWNCQHGFKGYGKDRRQVYYLELDREIFLKVYTYAY